MTDRQLPENAHMIPENAQLVFKGKIFDVYQWEQEMFDGSFHTFEMLRRPDTALVIPIVDDHIIVLDEEQPGKPIEYDRLVGGRVEEGESPLEAAKRELREEIGMEFSDWVLLEVKQPALKLEWFVYVYVAVKKTRQVETNHEVGEKITIKELSFDEFKQTSEGKSDILRGINTVEELLEKVGL
ncbi:hypothetical protein BH10PAT4_BH10PAT4_5320 [soil metagenome]